MFIFTIYQLKRLRWLSKPYIVSYQSQKQVTCSKSDKERKVSLDSASAENNRGEGKKKTCEGLLPSSSWLGFWNSVICVKVKKQRGGCDWSDYKPHMTSYFCYHAMWAILPVL